MPREPGVKSADAVDGTGSRRRRMRSVDVVKLAPSMSPARCLVNPARVIQMMKTGVRVSLQRAREVLEMFPGMFALAIRRVGEPNGGCGVVACRAVIAHVSPEPARLRLPVARSEDRHGRVICVQLRGTENVTAYSINQRREQFAGGSNPPGQRGAIEFDSLPGVNLCLAIEGAAIGILRDQDMGKQTRSSQSACDRSRWRRSFNHCLALAASELGADMPDHPEALRDIIQLLRNVLAKVAKIAATLRAAALLRFMGDNLARQMLRQWLTGRCRPIVIRLRIACGH